MPLTQYLVEQISGVDVAMTSWLPSTTLKKTGPACLFGRTNWAFRPKESHWSAGRCSSKPTALNGMNAGWSPARWNFWYRPIASAFPPSVLLSPPVLRADKQKTLPAVLGLLTWTCFEALLRNCCHFSFCWPWPPLQITGLKRCCIRARSEQKPVICEALWQGRISWIWFFGRSCNWVPVKLDRSASESWQWSEFFCGRWSLLQWCLWFFVLVWPFCHRRRTEYSVCFFPRTVHHLLFSMKHNPLDRPRYPDLPDHRSSHCYSAKSRAFPKILLPVFWSCVARLLRPEATRDFICDRVALWSKTS